MVLGGASSRGQEQWSQACTRCPLPSHEPEATPGQTRLLWLCTPGFCALTGLTDDWVGGQLQKGKAYGRTAGYTDTTRHLRMSCQIHGHVTEHSIRCCAEWGLRDWGSNRVSHCWPLIAIHCKCCEFIWHKWISLVQTYLFYYYYIPTTTVGIKQWITFYLIYELYSI